MCGWIYEYCLSLSQEPRNGTDIRQTQHKRFMKNKTELATTSTAATIPAVSLGVTFRVSFMVLSEPRRFGSTSSFSTHCPVVTEEDTRAVVRPRL